jgi:hypothetical protein
MGGTGHIGAVAVIMPQAGAIRQQRCISGQGHLSPRTELSWMGFTSAPGGCRTLACGRVEC